MKFSETWNLVAGKYDKVVVVSHDDGSGVPIIVALTWVNLAGGHCDCCEELRMDDQNTTVIRVLTVIED